MIDDTIKKDITPDETPEIPNTEPDVIDVDLGYVEKKRFRICGDYNRMLELNVSDLNITARLNAGYPKLKALLTEAQEKILAIPDDSEDEEMLAQLAASLTDIDAKMRGLIDYIFDTNASEVCAPSGNMFDPIGGKWRFEHIIETLTTLYSNGLDAEFQKVKNRVESKTSKYTKKRRK